LASLNFHVLLPGFERKVRQLCSSSSSAAGDVEVLINNAGILELATPLAEDALEKFNRELNVNVFGLIHIAQAFAPILKANGGGALVQLNSVASLKNFPDFATYSASKAAAYSITQGLRETLDEQGKLVVSVHPGLIETDMTDGLGFDEMTESPTLVSEAIIEGLGSGQFHVFPDTMQSSLGNNTKLSRRILSKLT
jgi:short-subunit dehydrogenase